jgi:Phage Mu protein F like protein
VTTPEFEDPNLPQRLRAQAFIREGEERIGRAWFRSVTRFLDRVRPAVLREGGVDPGRVSDHVQFWTEAVDNEVLPEVGNVLADAWRRVTRAGDPPTDPYVSTYLNAAGNRMRNTPDEVYAMIVMTVERGITEGLALERVRDEISVILGPNQWRGRAMTVARTETIGAVNAGIYRGAQLEAEQRGDLAPFLQWISTADERTRPTHVAADKQRTLLGQPFTVGGARLLFPGDPRGPANEVINCRCSILPVVLGETIDWTDRQNARGAGV